MDWMTRYLDRGTDFPLIHSIHTGSMIHPASYPKDSRSHFPGPSGGTYEGDYSLPPCAGVKTCQGIPPITLHLHERKVKLPLCMLWRHGGGLQVQLFRIKLSFQHWRWSSIYPHNKSNLLKEYNASHDKRMQSWQHQNQDRGSSHGTE